MYRHSGFLRRPVEARCDLVNPPYIYKDEIPSAQSVDI